MIGHIRNSVFTKVLCLLMGTYFLNISVDPVDPNPEHIPENLCFNDQESLVEIIFEKVLGFEDAILEYDDNDSGDNTNKNNLKVDLIVHVTTVPSNFHFVVETGKQRGFSYEAHLRKGFHQLDTPPPRT